METAQERRPDFPATGQTEDSREMCFAQGKACVYRNGDETRIVTEWPNGVVDELLLADKSRTRRWPDGRVEQFEPGDPTGNKYPHIKIRSRALTG